MVDIAIQRMDGSEPLLLERAERLAEGFFRLDPSSTRPDGLDLQLGTTPANEISEADVHTINRTFVARSPLSAWKNLFTAGRLPWLAALDPAWDLIALDEGEWHELDCRDRLVEAFEKIRGPYRGQAVATKMLHLKRWRLVPVCDSLVAHQIGASSSTSTIELVDHIRAQGRANLQALSSIQSYLAGRGIDRSLVRILDALLWTSHPASLTFPLIGIVRDWTEPAGPTSYH
jgi:Family of unknown function (DUF6308)